jgi:triacylglycerol esterase/lipase EstA (alpha/beta hydrolase family)
VIYPKLLASDDDLKSYDFLFWGYPTKLFRPTEDVGTIGENLKTEIDYLPKHKYTKIVLIGHSLGGLVIRSYIVKTLLDGKGDDLSAIRKIIL